MRLIREDLPTFGMPSTIARSRRFTPRSAFLRSRSAISSRMAGARRFSPSPPAQSVSIQMVVSL